MESIMELASAGDFCCPDRSPGIDRGIFPAYDDCHGLFESYGGLPCTPAIYDWSISVGETSTNCHWLPAYGLQPVVTTNIESAGEDDLGLRVVHLLMAAAEALTGASKSRDLAEVILARLKELLAGGAGRSSMVRIGEHFTDALQDIVDGRRQYEEPPHRPGEMLEAFQLLQDLSPYVKFGHFTANQAILEAVAGEQRVHVVDFDVMEGVQWASLMQAMVSRKDCRQQTPQLRITAVMRCGGSRRSATTVLETGRRLASFAASVGLQFSFGHCRLDSEGQFRPEAVRTVKGEVLVFNCALHPPHVSQHSAASVASFLAGSAEMGARVVTLVEEAAGADTGGGFAGLFMEELRRYSAILDSLEAGFPMQGRARWVVEKMILRPMITRSVGKAYRRQEEGEE
ncbi:Nodulation-signaling pathway 2 protein [Platanthera zijinensis]|uniref:Nodulation-signaling pathway 2 protein n=1 Tax=Platanthera zijinensis TaxID=2320716 RepID=A0AAP0AZH5_9ASPA